ncbi:hypothetical protein L3Q82_011527 [Scortum barcoo]|uniref:Uncharacterized protein n=1 Tax=Scortum barcoo TaxID=214431 RepID=A0ACB8W6B6_9TELE|nr:hypothetical protein L3Q82_011527 [Scortum barcoo]
MDESTSESPASCFLTGRQVGGIEEILEVFLPPVRQCPQLRPTDSPPPHGLLTNSSQTRVFASRTAQGCCGLLGLPVPVNCVRSPTGQHGPIGLLLQPDGIPYFRCPPHGFGDCHHDRHQRPCVHNFELPASTMEAENMSPLVHSDSMSPASLGICEKLFRRWELKTSLTEGSARRSQQTLTIRLGLPGLSNFLPPLPAEPTHHQVVIG